MQQGRLLSSGKHGQLVTTSKLLAIDGSLCATSRNNWILAGTLVPSSRQLAAYLRRSIRFKPLFSISALVLAGLLGPSGLASNITVASPVNGASISSPVLIKAHNTGCSGLKPSAFGYSIDSATGLVKGETAYDIDVPSQGIPSGSHVIHFKSWTSAGACPVVNIQVQVAGSQQSADTTGIPANAKASPNLDYSHWFGIHDGGTPGGSKGSTVFPSSTPLYDDALEFYMTYYNRGGERWSIQFAKDDAPTHFAIDTYVYIADPAQVQNLELDVNQVTSSGETVILGTQCSSLTGTWELAYTSGHYDHWWSSNVKCNPHAWAANQWHHIQIGMHRDGSGTVTHDWVNFDGTHSVFHEAPRPAFQKLGWPLGVIVVNYQIEGESAESGSVRSYIHKMTVYRW